MNTAIVNLVEYIPYPMRNERCAVALLARKHDGQISMHVAQQLRKARAINPACNVAALREGLQLIAAEIKDKPDAQKLYEAGATGISISSKSGHIAYRDDSEFEAGIKWALAASVEPSKPVRSKERASVSRLFIEIKNAFDSFGWLAPIGQSLEAGMVVPRFALSVDEGLVVDFAQQSGDFLAVQTVDYRHNAPAKRNEASAKLLTLSMAEQIIIPRTRRLAVFAGTDETEANAGVKLAERVCNDIFIQESGEDMRRLVDIFASSMGQVSMPVLRTN